MEICAPEGGDAQPDLASVGSSPHAIEPNHGQGGHRVHGAVVVCAGRVACRPASRPRRDRAPPAWARWRSCASLARGMRSIGPECERPRGAHGDSRVGCGVRGGAGGRGAVRARSRGGRDPRDSANRPLLRLIAVNRSRPTPRAGCSGACDGGGTARAAKHPRSALHADARSVVDIQVADHGTVQLHGYGVACTKGAPGSSGCGSSSSWCVESCSV